jgi:hypothetical protein
MTSNATAARPAPGDDDERHRLTALEGLAALSLDALSGLPEMLGTRECQIAVLNWGNGYGWPAGPCYYARL